MQNVCPVPNCGLVIPDNWIMCDSHFSKVPVPIVKALSREIRRCRKNQILVGLDERYKAALDFAIRSIKE